MNNLHGEQAKLLPELGLRQGDHHPVAAAADGWLCHIVDKQYTVIGKTSTSLAVGHGR